MKMRWKRSFNRFVNLPLFVALLFSFFSGSYIDGVIATVNGKPILYSQLKSLMKERELSGKEAGDPQEILEEWIENELIEEFAQSRSLKIDERDLDNAIDRIAKENHLPREELLKVVKKELNLTPGEYREVLRKNLLRVRIYQEVIAPKVVVDEADLYSYLRKHPERFSPRIRYKIRWGKIGKRELSFFPCPPGSNCPNEKIPPNAPFLSLPVVETEEGDLPSELRSFFANAKEEDWILFPRGGELYLAQLLKRESLPPPDLSLIRPEIEEEIRKEKLEKAFQEWVRKRKEESIIERFPLPVSE